MKLESLVANYTPNKLLIKSIKRLAARLPTIRLMEVCGTHTMAIAKNGIKQMLPENIKLISGPGCPVCVSTPEQIDTAIELCKSHNVAILTFGDMLKVPGSDGENLLKLRLEGHDVQVVYSALDCIKIAQNRPGKDFVFLSVGFETTIPTTAITILKANELKLTNLTFLNIHKLIPPAMEALLLDPKTAINGFICPGHVSMIIGLDPYKRLVEKYGSPCVVGGFDGIDILQAVEMLLKQIIEGADAEIQYKRCVRPEENTKALEMMYSVFDIANTDWRGLGSINESGLVIKSEYAEFDAQKKFTVKIPQTNNVTKCICGEILKGIKTPADCLLFDKACFPERPVGPCMVSSEGACAAFFKYERFRNAA